MAFFRGGPVQTMDQKGRITVPARFRDPLMELCGGKLVVAKSQARCLGLYPLPVWEQMEQAMRHWTLELDGWRRLFIGSATEVEIDSGTRVLIPPELRSWAGLERDVKFMGVGAYFELWDNRRYDESEAELLVSPLPESLRNFSR